MKIAIVISQLNNKSGGAIGVAFNEAQELQKKGHHVFVFHGSYDGKFGWDKVHGLDVFRIKIKDRSWFFRSYVSVFNRNIEAGFDSFLKEVSPEIVHFHNLYYHFPFSLIKISKKRKIKTFFTAHDVMSFYYGKLWEFINPNKLSVDNKFNYKISLLKQIKRFGKMYNPFRNLFIRYYLKYSDKIFAVSYSLKEALNQNKINNVEVIYNGIDYSNWRIGNEEVINFKKKYNLENKKIVLFAARLSPLKGAGNLIKAMEKVTEDVPDVCLLLMGEKNNYFSKLSKLVKKNEIPVIFTGWLKGDDLISAYYSCNLAVTPSLYLDPFNLINIEAMAAKKPVVGTCFGGTSEIVINNKTGYIVNPYNIDQLAEKIVTLLKNPAKAEKFGQAGYMLVKNKFSLQRQIENYLKFFRG